MKFEKNTQNKVRRMVTLALLTAIVVVLQLIGTVITVGSTPISLTLVPIVIGAIVLGPGAGAFLGAVFGVVVLAGGFSGRDWFTAMLLNISMFWTIAVCVVKGALCGAVAGWIAKALKNRTTLGCILAAVSAPIVNTGVFALFMMTALRPGLEEFTSMVGGVNAVQTLFLVLIGINFVIELAVNAALSAAIARIVRAVSKQD